MTPTPGSAFRLAAIGQIAVPVRDLERAVAFYRDTLGMRFLFQAPPGLAFFDCNGIRLLLDQASEERFLRHSSVIYFSVEDIQDAFEALTSRGVAFEGKPHLIAKLPDREVWMAFFRDPEENIHALMSELPV
jgi:methylmalonyl-CoA/ethylmalonyl-CoA epimerase